MVWRPTKFNHKYGLNEDDPADLVICDNFDVHFRNHGGFFEKLLQGIDMGDDNLNEYGKMNPFYLKNCDDKYTKIPIFCLVNNVPVSRGLNYDRNIDQPLTNKIKSILAEKSNEINILVITKNESGILPILQILVKGFPSFGRYKNVRNDEVGNLLKIRYECSDLDKNDLARKVSFIADLDFAVKSISESNKLVDTPSNLLGVSDFAKYAIGELKNLKKELNFKSKFDKKPEKGCIDYKVWSDKDITDKLEFRGLYNVGKGKSTDKAQLVFMAYRPISENGECDDLIKPDSIYLDDEEKLPSPLNSNTSTSGSGSSTSRKKSNKWQNKFPTIFLAGKSIMFDAGGYSLKDKQSIIGMKFDMGGGAGILHTFINLVAKCNPRVNIVALLPIAYNGISATAYQNDDIIEMHSGKFVEINNTDAEGRLCIADCVSYASGMLKADYIFDLCTLTGAQGMTTGMHHAAMYANDENLERIAVKVGKSSGDLVTPVVYAPEVHKNQFKSSVADMTNSVGNRYDAQVSCAGYFIEAHLDEDWNGKFMHIDCACLNNFNYSTWSRYPGFGVPFFGTMFRAMGWSAPESGLYDVDDEDISRMVSNLKI